MYARRRTTRTMTRHTRALSRKKNSRSAQPRPRRPRVHPSSLHLHRAPTCVSRHEAAESRARRCDAGHRAGSPHATRKRASESSQRRHRRHQHQHAATRTPHAVPTLARKCRWHKPAAPMPCETARPERRPIVEAAATAAAARSMLLRNTTAHAPACSPTPLHQSSR